MARSGFAYPRPGHPLLPAALVPYFGDDMLPFELASDAGLAQGTRLRDLGGGLWADVPEDQIAALVAYVTSVVRTGTAAHRLGGAKERLFEQPMPLDALRISQRARNALVRHGVAHDGLVHSVQLRDLADARHVGGTTLLQIAAAEEEALEGGLGQPQSAEIDDAANPAARPDGPRPSRAVRREATRLAKRRWSKKLSRADPRVGREVSGLAPGAITAFAAADLLGAIKYDPAAARRKAEAIRRFVARGDALARLPLEDELAGILDALTTTEHQRLALRRRFGWDGLPPSTLEVASEQIGVTRERVRQIEAKFRKRLVGAWTPALDHALRIVSGMKYGTARELQDSLREAKVVRTDFPLASLIRAARLFGREVPDLIEREGALAPADLARVVGDVQSAARRLTDHWGTTTIAELTSVLAEKGTALDEKVVRKSLATIDEIHFLDNERNWFWMSASKRNRLLNYVRKIMSVAGSIDLGELRDGVGRHHHMRGFRPPRAVLARLCADTSLYRVDGDRVFGTAELPDWREVLSGNEKQLAEALFEHGPVMRRADLEDLMVREGGMNRSSFYIYVTYSPILERFAPGVYGLRGARTSAAEVSAMMPHVVRSQVLREHGWTKDRRIWIVYRLSAAAVASGVLSMPAAFAPMLRGQFNLVTNDGAAMGTLTIEETRLWGLSPLYRRRGVEAGDHLLIVFNTADRSARVEVGDEALALEYQSAE